MAECNVIPFLNIDEALRIILNSLGYNSDEDSIKHLRNILPISKIIDFVKKHGNAESDVNFVYLDIAIYSELHELYPDVIMPPYIYRHEKLEVDDEFINLVRKKLIHNDLRINKSIIRQMIWKAHDLFISRDDIESEEHAINIVIKTYKKGFWSFPKNCPIDFDVKPSIQDLK